MQKSVSLLVTSVLMLFATASCATFAEDFDFGTEVVQIEKSLVSYYDTDHNHWYCREALIYVSPSAKKVWFPNTKVRLYQARKSNIIATPSLPTMSTAKGFPLTGKAQDMTTNAHTSYACVSK